MVWESPLTNSLGCNILNVKQIVQADHPTRKVSLAVFSFALFFSDICHWNKKSVLSMERLCSVAPIYWLPYQPTILPSHPLMDVTLRMCLSQEKGCPEVWKQNRSGLPFALNEALASKSDGEYLSVSHLLWVHLVALSNRGPRLKQRMLSVTASLKDLGLITRSEWVCAVVLHVHHHSFF